MKIEYEGIAISLKGEKMAKIKLINKWIVAQPCGFNGNVRTNPYTGMILIFDDIKSAEKELLRVDYSDDFKVIQLDSDYTLLRYSAGYYEK